MMETLTKNEQEADRLRLQDLYNYSNKKLLSHKYERRDIELRLFPEISWKELILYHALYWGAVSYSLYSFYGFSQSLKGSTFLSKKRSIYGTFQDQNDSEWNVFSVILIDCIPFGILHLIFSQIVRFYIPKILCIFYICFSSVMLAKLIGYVGLSICLFVPIVMFLALYTRSKAVIWLMWSCILIGFNTQHFLETMGLWLSDVQEGEYKTSVIVAWIILRSLSFSLDTCEEDPKGAKLLLPLFITLMAYCLYFPLLITGPYMPYTDFQEGLRKKPIEWDLKKLLWIIMQYSRFLFWFWLTDTLLYYFYAHALVYSSGHVSKMNSWQLAGFVFFLLVFFIFKYVVYYGLPAVIARAEGYDPPRHPRCVILVYRISDVWRYFDHGLYRFMVKHIYLQFIKDDRSTLRQLQGSAVVFTFIYIWHGVTSAIMWWSAINFIGVVIEKVGYSISESQIYMDVVIHRIPAVWERRLKASIASLFLLISVCSMVIFLSSLQNASVVLQRIFSIGFPVTTVITLLFFYCLVQCGMELENYRAKNKLKK